MELVILALAAVLLLAVLWGVGVPLPEETTALLAGAFAATFGHPWSFVLTLALGIAIADTIGYVRGRLRATEFTKFKRGRQFIEGSGFFATLSMRAFVSVRAVVPFMAGAMRMPRWRFHAASMLGALITATILVRLAAWAYALLPQSWAALIWSVLVSVITGVLVMRATRAHVALAREE